MNIERRKEYLKTRVFPKMLAAFAVAAIIFAASGLSLATAILGILAAAYIFRGLRECYVLLFMEHERPIGYRRYSAHSHKHYRGHSLSLHG